MEPLRSLSEGMVIADEDELEGESDLSPHKISALEVL
jgi:hypothetical protein